jgi:RNA polymerase subunit RPABC4/transcription elongation factor Spt4
MEDEQRECPNCGTVLEEGELECPSCGESFIDEDEVL